MATKKEMIKRKQILARTIQNIKLDYSGVHPDDMPDDIIEEIATLYAEMINLRIALGEMREITCPA